MSHLISSSATSSKPSAPRLSSLRWPIIVTLSVGLFFVLGMLVWQGITAQGNPDPTAPHTSSAAAIMDIAALIFREGLECVLVLAAITASMTGAKRKNRRPVAVGVGIGLIATAITWFAAIGIMENLGNSISALNLQAATGLLAIGVLLIVMNWFFHRIYWGGWISKHNRVKKNLTEKADKAEITKRSLFCGLAILGFTSLYREGFEIVLFLQGYRLSMGSTIVYSGMAIGLVLTGIIAVATFALQQRLPYRKMLVFTGVLLGAVLLVMVGEQVQEMQQASWIGTTEISWLAKITPDWVGMWFAFFPNVQGVAAQGIAALIVVGSYFLSRRACRQK